MAPSTIPPVLPPTVEEAYRRKCVQLKHRTREVENANEAAHLRLNRMKRQVEKMRLERAFLLEQLARRTSTNVEDSEGSPSPPPTPEPQPKDKPLRTKRGHRKGSLLPGPNNVETPPPADHNRPAASAAPSRLRATQSPSSDFSRSHSQLADHQPAKSTNGAESSANGKASGTKKGVPTAFDLYSEDKRTELGAEVDEDDVEEELSKGWKDLSDEARDKYQDMADRQREKSAAAKTSPSAKPSVPRDEGAGGDETPAAQDEDVEMGNYDSDQETQGEKQDD